MARMLMWRAAMFLAIAVGALMTALTWLFGHLLDTMCELIDEAEVRWILACSDRRVARRRRVNLAEEIRPLPGAGDDCR